MPLQRDRATTTMRLANRNQRGEEHPNGHRGRRERGDRSRLTVPQQTVSGRRHCTGQEAREASAPAPWLWHRLGERGRAASDERATAWRCTRGWACMGHSWCECGGEHGPVWAGLGGYGDAHGIVGSEMGQLSCNRWWCGPREKKERVGLC
jgi:hypothetical protein